MIGLVREGKTDVLTDALASVILQSRVLPAFRDGDIPGGIVAGTDAIIEQLSLDPAAAEARVAAAAEAQKDGEDPGAQFLIFLFIIVIWVLWSRMGGGGRRRQPRRRRRQ